MCTRMCAGLLYMSVRVCVCAREGVCVFVRVHLCTRAVRMHLCTHLCVCVLVCVRTLMRAHSYACVRA